MPTIKLTEDETGNKNAKPKGQEGNEETLETSHEEVEESHEERVEETEESVETKASQKGWRPKDQYAGDPEEWVDAEEFLARGPLYETIHKLNRKIKRMEETQSAFKDHYDKVEKTARDKAIAELRAELKTASENNDIGKALEVKDKIVELETSTKDKETKPSSVNPDYDEWVEKNQWYESDRIMRGAATTLGYELKEEHPDWTPKQVYAEVSKQIKESFPHKFKTESKVTSQVTTSKTRTASSEASSKKKLPAYRDLPQDAKVNYRRLVKSERNPNGILTHENFMKDYMAQGGPLETEE